MTAADTVEIMGKLNRLDDVAKHLMFAVIDGMSCCRLTCEEVAAATARMLDGADKLETLEDLVQLSNQRLIEEATPDE